MQTARQADILQMYNKNKPKKKKKKEQTDRKHITVTYICTQILIHQL